MLTQWSLADRAIGGGAPCFIIAEAGVNHNGSLTLARRLVDAAADAGADAVKFQTWITEKLCAPGAPKAAYQEAAGGSADQFEMLKALELPFDWHAELKARAEDRGLVFLSTPDDIESACFLRDLGVPALKVGSGELTNLPFLVQLAELHLPILLSTGMSTMEEVADAVAVVSPITPLGLLHCVSAYPAPEAEMNLRAIATLRSRFDLPIGLSDHTRSKTAAVVATGIGIAVLEKHLTLDCRLPGPDHAASLEPEAFGVLTRAVREAEAMLGSGDKAPVPSETSAREAVRRTLVYVRAMTPGSVLTAADFQALRTGKPGLPPAVGARLVGRTLRVQTHAGDVIQESDVR